MTWNYFAAAATQEPAPSYIFYSGVESGDLSDFDSTVTTGGTITAGTDAPYAGSYEIKIVMGNSNVNCRAVKNLSNLTELWFLGVFRLGTSYDTEGNFDSKVMFEIVDGAADVLSFIVRQHDTNGIKWRVYDEELLVLAEGDWGTLLLNTNYVVEFHWKAESGASAGDGVITVYLYTPGTSSPSPIFDASNITGTDALAVDELRVGTRDPYGAASYFTTGADMYFDEIYVHTSRIGPI